MLLFLKNERLFELELAVTISGNPSPVKSFRAILNVLLP